MIYDRMKAVPITGERCHFCGRNNLPLVKMKCCDQWSCCDTEFMSLRGGGYCLFQPEHYSICHFHHNENHSGAWQACDECRDFFGKIQFESEIVNSIKLL